MGEHEAGGTRAAAAPGVNVKPLLAGDPASIGPYRVLGRLGAGGMGTVYLAAGGGGARVAVKVIRGELARDGSFLALFRHEVAAARRVKGFCTARVLDADLDAERPYLVTEYVDGVRLDHAVARSGRLPDADLEGLAVGVATALAAIHGAGVVHRDLKPSNVILSYFGPKVIDFGIARALDASTLPGGSAVIGTPTWMAPEQFANRPVTPAVDIFVWGALVAYAGTGRRPFGQGSIPELAWRVTYQQPDLEGLPGFLRELVARAMAKDPAARPSATALLLALVDDGAEDPGDAATQLLRRTWRPSGEQVPPAAPAPRPEPPPVAAAEAPAAPAPRAEPPPEPAPSPAAAPAGPAPRPEPPPVAGAGGRAVGRWLLGLVLLAVAAVGAALLLRGGLGGSGQAGRPTPAASTRPAGRAGGAPPAGGPAAAAPAFCRAVPVPGRQGELAELTAPVYYTAAGDAPAGWLADLDLLRGALAQAGMRQGCTRAWQDGAGRRLEVAVYDLVTIPRAVALRARFEQALAARGAARLPQPPPAGSRGFALPPAGSGELVLFRCKQLVAGLHLNATGPAATGQLDRWAHDVDVRLTAANHCGTA